MPSSIEPIYGDFGRTVRQQRDARQWSQERLAKELRTALTRTSIANIEAGTQRVLLHTAIEIATLLEFKLPGGPGAGQHLDPLAIEKELIRRKLLSPIRARRVASQISKKARPKTKP